jgi:hypothetical protein
MGSMSALDAYSETRSELRHDMSIQRRFVRLPRLLLPLRVIFDECLTQLFHPFQLALLIDLVLWIFVTRYLAEIGDRLSASLI